MDPLEFVMAAPNGHLYEYRDGIYNIFKYALNYLYQLVSMVGNALRLPVAMGALAAFTAMNGMVIFAGAREPKPLSLLQRVVLRMPVLCLIAWSIQANIRLLTGHLDDLTRDTGLFSDSVIKLAFFVELFSANRIKNSPNILVFTYGELSLINNELNYTSTSVPHIATFHIISLCINGLIHLEGLFNTRAKTRLLISTISTVAYVVYLVHILATGEFVEYRYFSFLAIARFLPLITMALALAAIWSWYWCVALLMGRDNMALEGVYDDLRFNQGDTLALNLVGLSMDTLLGLRSTTTISQFRDIQLSSGKPYLANSSDGGGYGTAKNPFSQPKTVPIMDLFAPFNEIKQHSSVAWSLLQAAVTQPIDQTNEESDDEYVPESDVDDTDGELTDSEQDHDHDQEHPLLDSLAISGPTILTSHLEHGRLTRSAGRRNAAGEYLSFLSRQPRDHRNQPESCVVCLDSPRNVVLWPCGCLSLCSDCRAAIGYHQQTACVSCRRLVTGYSKIYRP